MQQLKFSGMDGLDEVTVSSIHVSIGQNVKKGDNLFDIEADKASDTITSPYDGQISKINFKSGDLIKTGDIVIEFSNSESDIVLAPTEKNEPSVKVLPQEETEENSLKKVDTSEFKSNQTVLATPLARKIARDLGIDITTIRGTGPNGRVLKSDLENVKNNFTEEITIRSNTRPSMTSEIQAIDVSKMEALGPIEHMKLTGIRKAVANAMVTSKYTAPHVTLMVDVDATELIKLRLSLKEEANKPENGSVKLTFMAFFIKAVAMALKEDRFKLLNSTFNLANNEILVKKYYNIGIAVDTDKGLVVPVIKNADNLTLFELANQVNQLADKARKGSLKSSDMQGGTFTITNFGSAGLKIGTPIINYPEVAILGLGALEAKAVLVDNSIAFHQFFPLSLSIDHRVIDGAPAGYFLKRIKELLEKPFSLGKF